MTASLQFNIFSKLENLVEKTKFPSNIFHFFGQNYHSWLNKILDELEVGESPLILGTVHSSAVIEGRVFIDKKVVVEPSAYIKGPAYIGYGSEIRHGAYIRGDTYIAKFCVVGHATEVKESCFLDYAKAGHFAYIGNSLLCKNVNLGAGTKLANLNLNKKVVSYQDPLDLSLKSTGLKKFGAILGDNCQTGCNSVLSPGTLLLPETAVYPCQHFRGTLLEGIHRS